MSAPLDQHQREIEQNRIFWNNKPLLREIYAGFYREILSRVDRGIEGRVVELGSGMGQLREHLPDAICTDLFPNPWLDLACDAYRLPFRNQSVSNLILFDVFHHLERPFAFFDEAARVIPDRGRLILLEPYISAISTLAYGCFHHEPVGWGAAIDRQTVPPPEHRYYAAQGNATRLFFGRGQADPSGWKIMDRKAFASFAYLLSGGLSKPALYPAPFLPLLRSFDRALGLAPRLFGARCLVVFERTS